jgi:cephalosporin hydroxylase
MIQDSAGRNMDIHGRYIDEEGNVITGACFYNGIITMQHRKAFEVFKSFLSKVRPVRIIEIGTSHGGLTLFLRHTLNSLGLSDSLIRTFDINQFTSNEILKKEKNLELIHDNIFSIDYLTLINSSYITDFLSDDGPNIILCDGGNKVGEFNLLSDKNFLSER